MKRITYKCKKCQWEKSVTAAWGDLRPKMCGGKKCQTLFARSPELLEVIKPEEPQPKAAPKQEPKREFSRKDKKEEENGERSLRTPQAPSKI